MSVKCGGNKADGAKGEAGEEEDETATLSREERKKKYLKRKLPLTML